MAKTKSGIAINENLKREIDDFIEEKKSKEQYPEWKKDVERRIPSGFSVPVENNRYAEYVMLKLGRKKYGAVRLASAKDNQPKGTKYVYERPMSFGKSVEEVLEKVYLKRLNTKELTKPAVSIKISEKKTKTYVIRRVKSGESKRTLKRLAKRRRDEQKRAKTI